MTELDFAILATNLFTNNISQEFSAISNNDDNNNDNDEDVLPLKTFEIIDVKFLV